MHEMYGKLTMEQHMYFVEELQATTFRHPEELLKVQGEFESYVRTCLDKELERLSLLHSSHKKRSNKPQFTILIVDARLFGLNHRKLRELNTEEFQGWIYHFLKSLIYENMKICSIPLSAKENIPQEYKEREDGRKYYCILEEFEKKFEYIENEEVLEDMITYIRLFRKHQGLWQDVYEPKSVEKIKEIYPEDKWEFKIRRRAKDIMQVYEYCLYFGLKYSFIKQLIIDKCEIYYAK